MEATFLPLPETRAPSWALVTLTLTLHIRRVPRPHTQALFRGCSSHYILTLLKPHQGPLGQPSASRSPQIWEVHPSMCPTIPPTPASSSTPLYLPPVSPPPAVPGPLYVLPLPRGF